MAESDRTKASQNWVMYQLGLMHGQQEGMLNRVTNIIAVQEAARSDLLKPEIAGERLDALVEVIKKFQNNSSMLLAYAMSWRLDWKEELSRLLKSEEPKQEA
jgi:hypothetical protein